MFFFRLIRLSVLLSLSDLKEKRSCGLGKILTRASLQLKGFKSSEISLVAACLYRLGQYGSPRSGKRTDSLVKVENSHAVPIVAS